MRLFRLKRFWSVLLLPLAIGLLRLISAFPHVVERYYTRGIYRFLSGVLGRFVSFFPFSVTGLLLLSGLAGLVTWMVRRHLRRSRAPMRVLRDRNQKKRDWSKVIATMIAIPCVLYFVFALICGPNYQRMTFAQQSGLDVHPSTSQELAGLCANLVQEANRLRDLVPEDENGLMTLPVSTYAIAKQAQTYYPLAARDYPALRGYVARPKPTVFSRMMSYLNITGIYIAFTFEPNVNVDTVDYNIPATMMHEMSHFKGYMREDEANFLAYLTCRYSGDPAFQYSGTMMALIHSTNALYSANRDLYYEVMEPLSDAVRADLSANNAYWRRFEGPVAEVSTAVNDVYLKSNLQESGVKSYGEMVDLLLAEYRSRQEQAE